MTNVPQRIADLSPEKREILLRRLKTRKNQQDVSSQGMEQGQEKFPPLQAYNRSGAIGMGGEAGPGSAQSTIPTSHFPLSFAQQRLWFLDQLDPGSTAYLISNVYRMHGRLDVQCFEKSLQELIRRHESLRTTFVVVSVSSSGSRKEIDSRRLPTGKVYPPNPHGSSGNVGGIASDANPEPVQVIHPVGSEQASCPLPVIDLQGLLSEQREGEVRRLADMERQRPCDLARGPLLRTYLLRTGASPVPTEIQEHVFVLTLHHIITDGWSYGVLVRELRILYHSFVTGQPSPLAPLPIQYADYALWQRQWLQGEVFSTQLTYWKKQLADVSGRGPAPPLQLPTDHVRPAVQTYRGATQELICPPALSEEMRTLSRQENVTLFMVLLAAFQVLLARYTGQSDISVGTPIANRRHTEIEGVIGFFVNTLVMRTDLSGNPTFLELLQRVHKVCLGAYAHQDIPFEKVVEELEPERDLSRTSLFQVMLVLQNTPQEEGELSEVSITSLVLPSTVTSKFDLTLSVLETEQGLHCTLEYNTDLFEADTIRRWLTNFQTLLEGVIQSPQALLSDLPLLTEAEREQLLLQWNATQADYPQEMTIHQLFEQQVEQTPDSVALVCEDHILTYRELNRRANLLAYHLQGLGIGPDHLVGISMARSVGMVVGLIAVLKAGGAYVPLDPTYPKERLAWILADAQISLVLTHHLLDGPLGLISEGIRSINLDTDWQVIAQARQENPQTSVVSAHLAYLIYTSGSTGQPKGVQVPHHAVTNFLTSMRWQLDLTAEETLLAVTPLSFDIAGLELFLPLVTGSRVVVVSREVARDGERLGLALVEHGTTIMQATPSTWRLLLATKLPHSPLRVLCGGETLPPDLACQLLDLGTAVWNLYGPTETTIWSTAYLVAAVDGPLPIGRPIANTQIYLLDRTLQPVPIGVTGELYIGGEGLARGYYRQPELTAERFIANPWNWEPGQRMYRTGDLARYRPDGTIEFFGRVDHQVKLRGHRIELSEIEATLRVYPGVQEAIVVLREEDKTRKYLMAYVVAGPQVSERRLPVEQLLSHLRERLPDYMVPTRVLPLPSIPLSPNGKVDRSALAVMDVVEEPDQRRGLTSTPLQELLGQIWQDVLHRHEIGVHENFFELGGHSLLATQVVARVCQTFQVDLPLRSLFEAPTIVRHAKLIEELMHGTSSLPLPAIVPMERPVDLPLSFAQERLWFLHQWEPESAWYNILMAFRLEGTLHVGILERCLTTVVQRHEVMRTTFAEHRGRPVQVIAPTLSIQVPVIDLRGLAPAEQDQQVSEFQRSEASRSFDLVNGPLLRVRLLRLDQQEHVLLFTMHHIVTDGWSIGVLIGEITTLYQSEMNGEPEHQGRRPWWELPELPIQYADYAIFQRTFLQGEVLDAQMAYWRKQLADLSPLELPTDHGRPAVKTEKGANLSHLLPKALSDGLQRLCQKHDVTLFMLLLGTFQVLLMRYTGQTDISVGTPVANRTREELEGLIGFFVNTLVMCTDLSGDPTFLELLQRVREVCLGAYAHQDIPFEKVVEELEPERDLSRSPLFQVMLILQNIPLEPGDLAGVNITPLAVETTTSKFDLTLFVLETEEGLHCTLEYSTDLFEADTIKRWLTNFQTLLEGVIQSPQVHISDLSLLTEAEREQLLVRWNATQADYLRGMTLHQLFERQVEQTPDAIALVFEDEVLTYAELNRRANKLAHYLHILGVGPEVLVGIALVRSVEMVIGLLAVLKAGGAYVPLDPAFPQQRLAHIIQDAPVTVLLTQSHLRERLRAESVTIVAVDMEIEGQENNPANATQPDHLAYMIYTSGSTGRPKGVLATHRATLNRLEWMWESFPFDADEICCQKTSLSFVDSVWEIFGPLLRGIRLVLIADEILKDAQWLIPTLTREQITRVVLVPSLLRVLLNSTIDLADELPHLKYWTSSGEALSVDLALLFESRLPQRVLLNLYGSSEVAGDVACYDSREGDKLLAYKGRPYVPIGRPIANTQLYILDTQRQPVPIGVTGELYVAGSGLARGYKNRPDLTAERFIPHPFVGSAQGTTVQCAPVHPGERLYRTGDLARYRGDGTVEYLERSDNQVKLRGFRIELGEIEATLRAHPAVQEAVVVLREEGEDSKYLVAYIVAHVGSSLESSQMQEHLRGQLPDYMLPARVLELPSMPLLPNGKVDRSALAMMDEASVAPSQVRELASTPLQELLGQIWRDVLHLPVIGVHENFFALGGHSLLAMQVVARVRQAFQVDLPLRSFLEAPTVVRLAKLIEELMGGTPSLPVPALVPMERLVDLPLSFAQERLWFLNQWESESAWYNVPMAFRLEGPLHAGILEHCLAAVVQRHEVLRTTIAEHGGRPVQVISPTLSIQVPVIDLPGLSSASRDQQVSEFQRLEASRSFDLVNGPLLRIRLLRLDKQEHVLLFTMHHIVTDGWSIGVLIGEITTLYQSEMNGGPGHQGRRPRWELPELPIQYADYALWQRSFLQGEVLDAQMAYWRKQLANVSPLELPTDHARPAVKTERGASQSLLLPKAVLEELLDLCQKLDMTLFMLLLGTFQVLLMRYARQSDISVGTPVANRTQPELEGMIGFFVNTLVMRTDLSGNPTFLELLRRVREVCLGAYAHQDIPFEKVVEVLAQGTGPTERDLSRTPLFQVMLILQNTPLQPGDLTGVNITPLAVETTTSKFDLTLSLTEIAPGLAPGGLHCVLEYSTDLFEADTITRMLTHFQTLLEGVLQNPQALLSELPLLTEVEREQLLVQWNATQADYPQEVCLHHFFEQQVEQIPDAIALIFEERQETYQQLNSQANQLAHRLLREGIGPEVSVGVYMQRSPELVTALLAVLKAAGAYVPLDPELPQERLNFLLEDAQVAVILTQESRSDSTGQAHRLPPTVKTICVACGRPEKLMPQTTASQEVPGFQRSSSANPNRWVLPENLAYLIYTSGSTGRPKGVMGTHRASLNRFQWMWQTYPFSQEDICCQKTNLGFVDAVWEIFGPLLQGVPLVIIADEGVKDPFRLRILLERHAVTRIVLVPSLLRVLLENEQDLQTQLRRLTYWVSSGEPLALDLAQRFVRSLPAKTLINLYGSSEVTADVTCYEVGSCDQESRVPIGRPIANTQVYLLDSAFQLVPIGVPGEVYIGGENVTRGYWQRADLTAERFLPHPFVGTGSAQGTGAVGTGSAQGTGVVGTGLAPVRAGARLYRTGDLARALPDGTLEFLGRVDQQVKIRGHRIELAEIEATLLKHPAIHEAVVLTQDLTSGADLSGAGILGKETDPRRDRGFPRLTFPFPHEKPLSAPANHALAGSPEVLSLQPPKYLPLRAGGEKRLASSETHLVAYLVGKPDQGGTRSQELSYNRTKELEFSLFYFANDALGEGLASTSRKRYKLLLEGAKFADTHNFTAVWTPERHFHPFGGLYPNPSVTSAAIATVTSRVQIRAGSVVLPLHDPLRVAEEWAVVDNLSDGRVGLSFATGWIPNDFVLAPEHYTKRKEIMMEKIETFRKLWRGEAVALRAPMGNTVPTRIYPQPIQQELPIWLTSSGSPETFRQAGEMGVNLLTHLLGQSIDELAEKIAIYHQARQKHGHPGPGHVTLMLHTFIGTESATVREKVRQPFSSYLGSSVGLIGTLAQSLGYGSDLKNVTEDDLETILAHAFDRYYETSGLMGTVSTCLPMVERLKEIGVDEVACLIDFGVDEDEVLASLRELVKLKEETNKKQIVETIAEGGVLVREDIPLDKRLIASVVGEGSNIEGETVATGPSQGTIPTDPALRNYLQEQLPSSMVPTFFVRLDALPLLPNGKVDRRALPVPNRSQISESREMALPQTPLQEQLALIWTELLHLPQVGIHENFFELGGHSLLAMQVVARIRASAQGTIPTGVDLPLRSLFEHPTIATLATYLEGVMHELPSTETRVLVPMARLGDLPLSFAQERLWFLNQWEPGSAWYNVPMAFRLSGSLHVEALERSLARVVQRHEVLRTTFKERAGSPFQVIAPNVPIQMSVIDLHGLTTAERDQQLTQLARTEGQQPFDLANGPVLRVRLLKLAVGTGLAPVRPPPFPTAPQEYVLLLTLHHIVSDVTSTRVLANEMVTLYHSEINDEPSGQAQVEMRTGANPVPTAPVPNPTFPTLPELPIQYADYALWQRKWLQGDVLDAQITYWKRQLAGIPAQLKLPTDRPRPAVQTTAGARVSRWLPLELQQQLKALSLREGVTLFMTGLAAFNVLLYCYTGQDDLVVGTDVANRNQVETEHLIGFFVNQLVLRTDLSSNPSFLEVMHRVRKVSLEAYAHQDLPFDRLVKALNPERDLSHTPLFQVKFLFQNAPAQELPVGQAYRLQEALKVEPLEFDPGTSQLDLLLNMSESDDGLSLWLEYPTDLFNAETMTLFLQQFEYVIRQVVALPEARLESIQQALAAVDREERARREQELQQVSLQKLGKLRRDRNVKKPSLNKREEIS